MIPPPRKPRPCKPAAVAEWHNYFPANDREQMAELRERERRYHEYMKSLCVGAGGTRDGGKTA